VLQLSTVKSWPSLGWASLGCIARSDDFNPFNVLEAIDSAPNEVWMVPYVFVICTALKPPQVELASLMEMLMCGHHVKVKSQNYHHGQIPRAHWRGYEIS
jgi:hypothetical protein